MKAVKRLVENLSLELTPDAPDGSAIAMSESDQTIRGEKIFEDGFKVGQDTEQDDKSLIRKADMDHAVSLIPDERVDEITLTPEMIAAKAVTLSGTISTAAGGLAKLTMEGSPDLMENTWFGITDNVLSWENYPQMADMLFAGVKIYVRYIGL